MPTTNTKTIGVTGNFLTEVTWYAGIAGNLVADDREERGQFLNEAHTGSTINFSGSTTDATRNWTLEVIPTAPALGTVRGTGVTIALGGRWRVFDGFATLKGFELNCAGLGIEALTPRSGTDITFKDLWLYDGGNRGIIGSASPPNFLMFNVLAAGFGVDGIHLGSVPGFKAFLCGSIDNANHGFQVELLGGQLKDCYSFGNSAQAFTTGGSPTTTIDFCACDDTSITTFFGPGTGNQESLTYANQLSVITSGSENWAVKAGSDLFDTGTTIATVTTDAIGTSRPQGAAYDIGPIEKIVAAPPLEDADFVSTIYQTLSKTSDIESTTAETSTIFPTITLQSPV